MNKVKSFSRSACAVALLCCAMPASSSAQSFVTFFHFDGTDGYEPNDPLVQGTDGNLYGTTYGGGGMTGCVGGCGTVFKITPTGKLTTLYRFCAKQNCTDGANPEAGLVLGTDGNLYGTTWSGGTIGWGTVFKITPQGALTSLHNFAGSPNDGALPAAALIQGTDGNFYGTTYNGGNGTTCNSGCGTVFKMTPQGTLTILQNFDATNGANPIAALVQAANSSFYGATAGGGANTFCTSGCGAVFEMNSSGTILTVIHNFRGNDGADPQGAVVQSPAGAFYGTSFSGGLNSDLCSPDTNSSCGTVFRMTAAGTLATLHRFDGTDGGNPRGKLVQGTDGNLYGTTSQGGSGGAGTVFKPSPSGVLTTLHNLGNDDGSAPDGLIQATSGVFYGAAQLGGANGNCFAACGSIFSEDVGLGPFVVTVPTARKIGQSVIILGTNLAGTTSVTFNGTSATFKVVSATEISTAVPSGATTGPVLVVTPAGTLKSNVPFRVLP